MPPQGGNIIHGLPLGTFSKEAPTALPTSFRDLSLSHTGCMGAQGRLTERACVYLHYHKCVSLMYRFGETNYVSSIRKAFYAGPIIITSLSEFLLPFNISAHILPQSATRSLPSRRRCSSVRMCLMLCHSQLYDPAGMVVEITI